MKLFHGSDVKNINKKKEGKESIPKIKDVFYILNNVHQLGKIPESIKRLLFFAITITVLQNIVSSMFVYFLEGAREYVTQGRYIIGLICFGLYVSRYIFSGVLRIWQNAKNNFLTMKIDLHNQELSTILLGKTADKVDYSSRIIKDTVLNYFGGIYELRRRCITVVITMGTSLLSMATTVFIILRNDSSIYSILTVAIIMISYSVFLFIDNKIQKLWDKGKEIRKEYRDKSRNYENDLVNLEYISRKHFKFLSKRFLKAESDSMNESYKLFREMDKMELFRECVSIISLVIILLLQFAKLGGAFSLEVFIELISLYTIVSTLMSTAGSIVSNLSQLKQQVTRIREEETAFNEIILVYELENIKKLKNVENDCVNIKPYSYSTDAFELTIRKEIFLKNGQMTLLNGESGTGKSTLIDIITGKKGNMGYNLNVIKYQDGAKLGSGTVLEEILWGEKIDYNKFVEVLKGAEMYYSLKAKADIENKSLVEYLASIPKSKLSDGMEQRVVLASILYHLDCSTDLLLFDEPISAIDEKKAVKIIKFIKNYCNRDKKRFILLATHQYKWILQYVDKEVLFNKLSETQTVIE